MTVASGDPSVVLVTPMPLIIPPGERVSLLFRASRNGTGGDRDVELEVSARTCGRVSAVTVRIHEIDLATTLSAIDYRTVNVGRTVDLDAKLVNNGTTSRTIDRVVLSDPSAPFVIVDDLAGRTIGPGETLTVPVRYTPTVEGASSVELQAILTTPCDDTLRSSVSGRGVKSAIFIGERELDFGARFRCDALCQEVVIEGVGTVPVSIARAAVTGDDPNARWTVSPSNFPMTILPGESLKLTLCFDAPASATMSTGTLVIETDDRRPDSRYCDHVRERSCERW